LALAELAVPKRMPELTLLPKLTLQSELLAQLGDLRLLDVSGRDRIDPVQRIHAEPRRLMPLLAKQSALLRNRRYDRIHAEGRHASQLLLRQLLNKLRLLRLGLLGELSLLRQLRKLRLLNVGSGHWIDVPVGIAVPLEHAAEAIDHLPRLTPDVLGTK
jgi:hypothetical protein